MHSTTLLTMSVAAVVACMPVNSEARADRNGLEACAKAMTEHMSSNQGAPVDFRLDEGSSGHRSAASGTWYLDARHPQTDEVVARIDCRVNSRAQVISMTQVPLSANNAPERAIEQ